MKKAVILIVLFSVISILIVGCTEKYVVTERTVVETREVVVE